MGQQFRFEHADAGQRYGDECAAAGDYGDECADGSNERECTPSGRRGRRADSAGHGAPAPLGGGALTVGDGAVWAMGDAESTLYRIDPRRNAIVARIKVSPPEATAAGDSAVWLSYPSENAVSRIDPATNKVTATIHVGPQPAGIALSPGAVWVADAGGQASPRSIRQRTACWRQSALDRNGRAAPST